MASYRVYFIDETGHIRSAREFACVTDEEALDLARIAAEGQRVEVWNQARLVARLEPARDAAAA